MEDNHMHATAGGKEESTITRPFGRRPSSVALPFLPSFGPLSLLSRRRSTVFSPPVRNWIVVKTPLSGSSRHNIWTRQVGGRKYGQERH